MRPMVAEEPCGNLGSWWSNIMRPICHPKVGHGRQSNGMGAPLVKVLTPRVLALLWVAVVLEARRQKICGRGGACILGNMRRGKRCYKRPETCRRLSQWDP